MLKRDLTARFFICWLVLALPLLVIGVWLGVLGAGYGPGIVVAGWVAALAFAGFLALLAHWRVLGPASWPVAWLLYVAGLLVTLADALAWYFQGSSFSVRFFANVRLDNLLTGLHAFVGLAVLVLVAFIGMLVVSAWLLLWNGRRKPQSAWRGGTRAVALLVFALIAVLVPSPWERLGGFFVHYEHGRSMVASISAADEALLADPDPVPRDAVAASPGKNLVIIYMESLERIYTDNKIFPGLTPNLNYWRARGLDYAGYLTFTGADYTIAGLFASQCGAPYLPSPSRALGFQRGNDANATSFQPSLTCLGDVLHAAGYRQVFMNGVDLSFADDGEFFRLHGFDQVLGLKELENANANRLPHPGWGLYDSDLFKIATRKFKHLAGSGRPFNLDVLTIDNHPPHGRPSPGCPKYAANSNDVLQAVHCTDYLVGKFLDHISQNPAWKNTVVVVMSDHQSMRNDAWPLYPKSYKRRPLLFILNAGQGRRTMRFYHMDIAPTVLQLMHVKTNATFLAGADRSAANAPGSPPVNDATDVAVLRKALWARAQPLELCKRGVLVGAATRGVRIGGFPVPFLWDGRQRVGLTDPGGWLIWVDPHGLHANLFEDTGVEKRLKRRVPNEAGLLIEPLDGMGSARQFSVDWISKHGGRTRVAEVPRLRDLEISSPHCASLLKRMNALPAGKKQDFSTQFKASTAPLYPPLPTTIDFRTSVALPLEREIGWLRPEPWGSYALGDYATLGFTLPRNHCHAMNLKFRVHPYLATSRPTLGVQVFANGKLAATWQFAKEDREGMWTDVVAPVRTRDAQCRVDLRFVFSRPGASPPMKGEDGRPLQLLFRSMQATSKPTGAVVVSR